MNRKYLYLLLFSAIIIVFGACTPQRNLIYFQNDVHKDSTYTYVYPKDKSEFEKPYTLTENDELYINIICADDENAALFGKITTTASYGANEISIYMNSYTIDSKGYLTIPALEPMYLKGLTLEQAKNKIEEAAHMIAYDAVVICKLVNFKIEILGEINRPGKYSFAQDKVSIYDVIATGGDLTYFANRKLIRIIRKEKSKDVIYTLDLRNADVLQDPNYYLKSGDIVYVEPNRVTRGFHNFNTPMGTIASSLSIISTAISLVLLILTLKNR
ncbi:MAG: polysaccharide biosynthesis/export family protein [Bacteroidales bacterium]|nr:polysaccharide biosynthesis/export family protein [Bacteroidales bacterium]